MGKKAKRTGDPVLYPLQKRWEKVWDNLNNLNVYFQSYADTTLLVHQKIKMEPLFKCFENLKKECEQFYDNLDEYAASLKSVSEIEITLPWESDKFKQEWTLWKEYLIEQHQITIGSRAEKKQLEMLSKITDGQEDAAYPIIDYAIANLYKMFFKLDEKKPKENKKPKFIKKDDDFS